MHETLSNTIIGYIDCDEDISIGQGMLARQITGWVVDVLSEASLAQEDFQVVNKLTNETVITAVKFNQRDDVFNFYQFQLGSTPVPKYVNSGFSLIFPSETGSYSVLVRGRETFVINIDKTLDNIIRKNPKATPELIVVDNFYDDPDSVRAYALQQEFKANEKYHKGSRTEKRYIPSWVKGEFSRLLNKEVTEFVGATGVFQYCVAKDNIVYHYDTQMYAAMVYLSPNAPLQTGTRTLKSKITGLTAAATDEDAARLGKTKEELDALSFNGNNFYDRHNFEIVDTVANIYNRCVIFNAQSLHAATSYYGDTKENGRLFHLYFFNVKK